MKEFLIIGVMIITGIAATIASVQVYGNNVAAGVVLGASVLTSATCVFFARRINKKRTVEEPQIPVDVPLDRGPVGRLPQFP